MHLALESVSKQVLQGKECDIKSLVSNIKDEISGLLILEP